MSFPTTYETIQVADDWKNKNSYDYQLRFKVYRNNKYEIVDVVLGTIEPITSGTGIYPK